jgi:hypothetical protein
LPTFQSETVHLLDDGRCVSARDLGDSMAFANLELSDAIARDSRLARDGADQIARTDAVAFTNGEEHARKAGISARRAGCRTIARAGRPVTSTFRAPLRAALGAFDGLLDGALDRLLRLHSPRGRVVHALAFHEAQRGRGDLDTIELGQERLERHELSRRKSRLQLGPKRGAEPLVLRASLGGGARHIDRLDSA